MPDKDNYLTDESLPTVTPRGTLSKPYPIKTLGDAGPRSCLRPSRRPRRVWRLRPSPPRPRGIDPSTSPRAGSTMCGSATS
jgi:hypothetical protein